MNRIDDIEYGALIEELESDKDKKREDSLIKNKQWEMKNGEVIYINDMRTGHIKNCIAMIKGFKGWRTRFLPLLEKELNNRKERVVIVNKAKKYIKDLRQQRFYSNGIGVDLEDSFPNHFETIENYIDSSEEFKDKVKEYFDIQSSMKNPYTDRRLPRYNLLRREIKTYLSIGNNEGSDLLDADSTFVKLNEYKSRHICGNCGSIVFKGESYCKDCGKYLIWGENNE